MIEVFTRSINDELFKMMRMLIPEEVTVHQVKGMDKWEDALTFIEHVIGRGNEWAVIVDEDCFIHDWQSVIRIVNHMAEHGFSHAGMPDRGAVPHRTNRWTTLNPFFNVLHCSKLRYRGALDPIDQPAFNEVPEFEIFDNLYLQMWKVGNPLYLKAATRSDGITTHLMDHEGNFFALHSWYSREWTNGHKDRIKGVYQDALNYRQ